MTLIERIKGWFTSNQKCDRPPEGWYCTREAGHEGPCAAHAETAEIWSNVFGAIDDFFEAIEFGESND